MQKGRVRKYERENIFDTMKTDEKYQVMYYAGAAISLLVGLWHFTVPWMFGWASYIPYETLVVSAILLKQLGFSDSVIIEDYMKTKDNLLDFLKAFAAEHPEVNIHTILPREENIKKVLAALSQIEEKAQSVFTGEADI